MAAAKARQGFEIGVGALGVGDVVRLAGGGRIAISLAPAARERVEAAHVAYQAAVRAGQVYGATTGVGANRSALVSGAGSVTLAARILRSHAGGAGRPLADVACRATMLVRAEQLSAGRSGVAVATVEALVSAVALGAVPALSTGDSIGTGDLAPLAQLALVLAGERPWRHGGSAAPRLALDEVGGLAFISSNAETIARACLATADTRMLVDASLTIAAISHAAVHASTEPLAAATLARPGQRADAAVAATLAELIGETDPARVQDPYGFRALVSVTGPMLESLARLESTLETEIVAGAENPLVDVKLGRVLHHGGFDQMRLAVELDAVRLALTGVGALSSARVTSLTEPAQTGLAAFLADGEAGSSGVMILEFSAAAALADLRHAAQPATLASTVISRGQEDHASFASQGASRLQEANEALERLLAVELVSAVRPGRAPRGAAVEAFRLAVERLPSGLEDRPLESEVRIARTLLRPLAAIAAATRV